MATAVVLLGFGLAGCVDGGPYYGAYYSDYYGPYYGGGYYGPYYGGDIYGGYYGGYRHHYRDRGRHHRADDDHHDRHMHGSDRSHVSYRGTSGHPSYRSDGNSVRYQGHHRRDEQRP